MQLGKLEQAGQRALQRLVNATGWFRTPELLARETAAFSNNYHNIIGGIARLRQRCQIIARTMLSNWREPVHVVCQLLNYRLYREKITAEADLRHATEVYQALVNRYVEGNYLLGVEIGQSSDQRYFNIHCHLLVQREDYLSWQAATPDWRRGRNPAERWCDMKIAPRRREKQTDVSYIYEVAKYITKASQLSKLGRRKICLGNYSDFTLDRFACRLAPPVELDLSWQKQADKLQRFAQRLQQLKRRRALRQQEINCHPAKAWPVNPLINSRQQFQPTLEKINSG